MLGIAVLLSSESALKLLSFGVSAGLRVAQLGSLCSDIEFHACVWWSSSNGDRERHRVKTAETKVF